MKRSLSALRVICLLAVVLVAFAGSAPSSASGELSGVKVCIDPGHGGSDPGAVNEAYGLHESDINLDVTFALRNLLAVSGAEVVLTRSDDTYLDNRNRYTFCNAEQATLLLSVHTNSAIDTSMDGAMALYFKSEDRELAQVLYDVMFPALRETAPDPDGFINWGLSRYASGVLMKSDMPAAMMEPVLMSYEPEAALLVPTIGGGECPDLGCRRGQIARALYEGVLAYAGGGEQPGGAMHVASYEMDYSHRGRNSFVSTVVAIADQDGGPVSGATVSLETTLDGTLLFEGVATTGDAGTASFTLRTDQAGTYISTVTAVVKEGWTYDSGANMEDSGSVTVP